MIRLASTLALVASLFVTGCGPKAMPEPSEDSAATTESTVEGPELQAADGAEPDSASTK